MQNLQSLKLAKLLYAREHIYENNWSSDVHSHSHTELFYITCGEGAFSIAGSNISVRAGDFLIINTNVPHTEVSSKQNSMGYIVLGVTNAGFIFKDQEKSDFMYSHENALSPTSPIIFKEIHEQFNSGEKYSSEICALLLETAILYLLKGIDKAELVSEPHRSVSKECAEVKRYIDSHYRETLTIDFLSKLSHLNKFYLIHSFKRAFGMTPINYQQFCRISEGRRLLTETNMPISQIAQALGFSSQSSFTQCFKKTVLLTPSQLRKSANITIVK